MKTFNTCDDTMIYDFYSCIDKKDLRYLIKSYEKKYLFKGLELKLTEEELKHLNDKFHAISKEFNSQNVTKNMMKELQSNTEIEHLTYKREILLKCLELFETFNEVGVLNILNEIGIAFDESKNIEQQVKGYVSQVKFFNNRIKLLKVKHDRQFNKTKSSEPTGYIEAVNKKAIYISLNLGLNNIIDLKKTTLTTWSNLLKIDEARIESMKHGRV